jgi:uncharacterized membrane protein
MVLVENLFRWMCHQLPSRSPQWNGMVFPLCWRCAGLHLGLLASYVYLATNGGFRRRLPDFRQMIGASLLMLPFAIDGGGNAFSLWSSPGWFRALTGLGAGMLLPLMLVPLTQFPMRTPSVAIAPTLSHGAEVLWPTAIGCAGIWLLVQPHFLFIFQSLAVAVAIATVLCLFHLLRAFLGWSRGEKCFSNKNTSAASLC